jgi:hypothetical protein
VRQLTLNYLQSEVCEAFLDGVGAGGGAAESSELLSSSMSIISRLAASAVAPHSWRTEAARLALPVANSVGVT